MGFGYTEFSVNLKRFLKQCDSTGDHYTESLDAQNVLSRIKKQYID